MYRARSVLSVCRIDKGKRQRRLFRFERRGSGIACEPVAIHSSDSVLLDHQPVWAGLCRALSLGLLSSTAFISHGMKVLPALSDAKPGPNLVHTLFFIHLPFVLYRKQLIKTKFISSYKTFTFSAREFFQNCTNKFWEKKNYGRIEV